MNKTFIDFTPLTTLAGSDVFLVDHTMSGNIHEIRTVSLSSMVDYLEGEIGSGGGGGGGGGSNNDPTKLPLTGGTLTGGLQGTTAEFSGTVTGLKFIGDGSELTGINTSGQDPTKLPLSGGTLTGKLNGINASFSSNVTAAAFYGNGSNLTGVSALDTTRLPLSGGTMTGKLNGINADFSSSVSAVAFYGNGSTLSGIANSAIQIKDQRIDITSSDNGCLLRIKENGPDNPQRVYLPALNTANILNGFQVMVLQEGTKQLRFTPYGSDGIISIGNRVTSAAQNSVVTITKLSSTDWLLYGDLI